jgi:hypothetical protein
MLGSGVWESLAPVEPGRWGRRPEPMTLTRLLPSLRRTLPDPLSHDLWPEATIATTTDVVVSGISLLRLVEVCGTPCIHSGAAVVPGTNGRPSDTAKTAVLVVRVTEVMPHASGNTVIETDARLDNLRLIWSETRLINRASTAHGGVVLIARRPVDPELAFTTDVASVDLPLDLRVGDLLAIPSRPITTTWALRPHPLTGTFALTPDTPAPDLPQSTSCSFPGDQPAWLSALE